MGCRVFCLAFLCLVTVSYAQLPCILITPSVLRIENEETVVVDGLGRTFNGDIMIQDFPKKRSIFAQYKISVNGNDGYGTVKMKIPAKHFENETATKHYVYVSVESAECLLEKVVLVSFQSGYIFIQTDKPIYTPKSTVRYRIFMMTNKLQPVNKNVIIEFLDPNNVIRRSDLIRQKSGITSLMYSVPEIVSYGVWTISAKYEESPDLNYTANFEVKEYILPSFEIKITTSHDFFYIDDKEFRVKIEAHYLYGKPVNGHAFVMFGVKLDDRNLGFSDSLRRISLDYGEAEATLKREDIIKTVPNIEELLWKSLYVTVTIITDTEYVQIVLTRSRAPAGVFEDRVNSIVVVKGVEVFVTNPDGSPASRVPIVVQPGNVVGITKEDGTTRLPLNTAGDKVTLPITVRTQHGKLPDARQASATMTAEAYVPLAGNYLHISITTSELKLGENAQINFVLRNTNPSVQNQINHFTYLILNKGQIMEVGRQPRGKDKSLVTKFLRITENLIPSFRIVAYYTVVTGSGHEIISDSVWVDVVDSCIGTLELSLAEKDKGKLRPGNKVSLKVRADYNATVGLVAVDKAVFVLNSKFKLSQSKVWDSVEKSDIGCTPGSGANTEGVFYDAGLTLHTTFKTSTKQRSEHFCENRVNRKRRASVAFNEYKGDDYEDEDYLEDEEYVLVRSYFPESWLWRDVHMTKEPDNNGISTNEVSLFLEDSITTWEVLAVSLSENKGICVSKPYDITVMMDFFIDLKLPYSVVRNEQVEIRAILYNYGYREIKARVYLIYNKNICSLANAKKNYQQRIKIPAHSSIAVPFVIVPLELGEHYVEVKAVGQFLSDGVKKKLNVVPEGKRVTVVLKSVTLEPEVKGKGGVQEEKVSTIDRKSVVPNTNVKTTITIQGTPISQMVEEAIHGLRVVHLIVMPRGSGEENMMYLAPGLIAVHYLDSTNQWDRVGAELRTQAIDFIKKGYDRQLTFRKSSDQSFAVYLNQESSTWLNAYVVRVFSLLRSYITVENDVLCGAVKWLILQKQNSDGVFLEKKPVYHQEMTGGLAGTRELDTTFTSFVLVALLDAKEACAARIHTYGDSVKKAMKFVSEQYPNLQTPYTTAIASYALAKGGELKDTKKLLSASTDNTSWNERGSQSMSLEATSYALLTLLLLKQYELTRPIVSWIAEQRYYGEVFTSTQATVVTFEALAQYEIAIPTVDDLDLEVSLNIPSSKTQTTYRINLKNAMEPRSATLRTSEDFVVTARGKGQGLLKVESTYYRIITEEEKKCQNFHLSVTMEEDEFTKKPENVKRSFAITICTRFLKTYDATMSIIDVSMMTGFSPDIDDLKNLMKGVDRYISNFEINKGASDKGTLIIYMNKISHSEDECIKFHVHQYFKVGLIQPASVTVYDYYTSENHCTKFYHIDQESALFGKLCLGDVCRCAEGNCYMQQRIDNLNPEIRLEKACSYGVDFVFKIRVDGIEPRDNYVSYNVTVVQVVKEGTDGNALGNKRDFISHDKCKKALNLEIGKNYITWGKNTDIWSLGSSYAYIIGRDTWIERMPSDRECQDPEFSELCSDLELLIYTLESFGCPL